MRPCTFLAALLALTTSAVLTAEEKVNEKDLFEQYIQKFGPPGPEHKLLEPLVGTWHANVKMWHDPAQSPHTSEGTLERKSIMDGRFIQENFSGKMMGKAFTGQGTIGYDRAKQKFVASWIDSISTALHVSHGAYDKSSNTWTYTQEEDCPITGKRVKTRDTLRIVSPDEQRLEMYRQMGDAKEVRTMEITLTRKK